MTERPTHRNADVAILGGGLAGLCLALQLRQRRPETTVVVLERRADPPPRAAFKVGESSVEMGSHYFDKVLGLTDLLGDELRKFGLRFFFSAADNRDIARRLELGPSHYLTVPSFQIDRGQFEAQLAARVVEAGATLLAGTTVKDITGLESAGDKHIRAIGPDGPIDITAPWVIDCAGRAGLLKRRLDLAAPTRHRANAAWFRIDANLDVDAWSSSPGYRGAVEKSRRLSTNHLMGPGYWVWLIPLAGGETSVGIAADATMHPFDELRTIDAALDWLERHEPQLRARIEPHEDRRLDFLAYRDYARNATRVMSADGWALGGEAGLFNDPLYSPGSDFIGMGNELITELVCRQLDGEAIDDRAETYQRRLASIYSAVMTIYRNQYPIMGSPRVMTLKILWDFTMYWGGIAPLYMHGKIADIEFMERAHRSMLEFASEGFAMQRLFRKWAPLDTGDVPAGFIDYCELPLLARLNRELLEPASDDELLARLRRNLGDAVDFAREIRARAAERDPSLAPGGVEPVTSNHLASVLGTLWPTLRASA